MVGVAEDGKYHDLTESPQPAAYLPITNDHSDAFLIVRSPRAPSEMAGALRGALGTVLPNVPISVESWSDSLSDEFFPAKAATVSLGVMGLLAALLAVTGIFGMAAYSVSRRMKELGIRVALGARKPQVMRAALGRPALLLGIGSLLGLMAGFVAGPLLGRIVYEADPRDPLVISGGSADDVAAGPCRNCHPRTARAFHRPIHADARGVACGG